MLKFDHLKKFDHVYIDWQKNYEDDLIVLDEKFASLNYFPKHIVKSVKNKSLLITQNGMNNDSTLILRYSSNNYLVWFSIIWW